MQTTERTYRMYLEDILLAMKRIAEYIEGHDFKRFMQDYKTVDAVIRNFEVIGEASKNLPDDFKEKYNHVPWHEMYYLRNKVSHEYFGIDLEAVWATIKKDIPELKREVEKLKSIKVNQRNSMINKASQGNLMSRAAFGYKIENGKLIPAENYNEIEEIFEEFLNVII